MAATHHDDTAALGPRHQHTGARPPTRRGVARGGPRRRGRPRRASAAPDVLGVPRARDAALLERLRDVRPGADPAWKLALADWRWCLRADGRDNAAMTCRRVEPPSTHARTVGKVRRGHWPCPRRRSARASPPRVGARRWAPRRRSSAGGGLTSPPSPRRWACTALRLRPRVPRKPSRRASRRSRPALGSSSWATPSISTRSMAPSSSRQCASQLSRRLRAELSRPPPRRRRDTCSMAWTGRLASVRRSQHDCTRLDG